MSGEINNAGNIFRILANLPNFLRKPILKNKLTEFSSATEDDKKKMISLILHAAVYVDSSILSTILKSWFEVLAELDTEKITAIFEIYCETALRDPKSLERLDIGLIIDVFSKLEIKQKEKLADCLKEVFFTIPNKYKILNLIPKYGLEILGII